MDMVSRFEDTMADRCLYEDIEKFMESPLVTWFSSCLEGVINHKLTFEELVDGVLLYNVFLEMDIHGQSNDVVPPDNDHVKRLKNLEIIMRNMRLFYEEDSVLLKEPNLRFIARAAHSNLQDVELLLVLFLGCAVKCPNKKRFIDGITQLEGPIQLALASHIGKVTFFPEYVLCRDMLLIDPNNLDLSQFVEPARHNQKVCRAFEEIQRICKERSELIEREENATPPVIPHCVLELNEWKSKALQLKNIEDEYLQELQKYAERLEIVEKENVRLASEAKAAKDYRDALDVAMEKVLKVDRLEHDVGRYKIKLENMDTYKCRVQELETDNKLLNQNKEELADQLDMYKAKATKLQEVEAQVYTLQEQCDKLILENDALKKKMSELADINNELESRVLHSTQSIQSSTMISKSDESLNTSFDTSIRDQLVHSSTSDNLRIELENHRLSQHIESLREDLFHESSSKILNLEKEKKSLELTNNDLTAKIRNLEEALASASKEKKRKPGKGEIEWRIVALEFEKKKFEKELESSRVNVQEKAEALEASSKLINKLQAKLDALQAAAQDTAASDDKLNSSILESSATQTSHDGLTDDLRTVSNERDMLNNQVQEAQLKIERQGETIEKLEQRLKEANSHDAKLKAAYQELKYDFNLLTFEYRKLKHQIEKLTELREEDQDEMRAKNLRIIELDLENSKLQHRCEFYYQLHEQMESDKTKLMEYVTEMIKHNHELVNYTLEDKEFYHAEDKKKSEHVNRLCRVKEKLEEKIMNHYRNMTAPRLKKPNKTVAAVKKTFGKVRQAGSELFSRSKKSSSGENSCEISNDFEFSRPNAAKKDNQPRNRKSVDFMDGFQPEKFSFNNQNNETC